MYLGPLISKFVACNFLKLFTHMKAYKNRDYEQALIETFLKFDDILRTEKVNALLKKFQNNQLPQNYEFDMKISFNYLKDEYLLTEFPSKPISLDITEETFVSDKSSSNNFFKTNFLSLFSSSPYFSDKFANTK